MVRPPFFLAWKRWRVQGMGAQSAGIFFWQMPLTTQFLRGGPQKNPVHPLIVDYVRLAADVLHKVSPAGPVLS